MWAAQRIGSSCSSTQTHALRLVTLCTACQGNCRHAGSGCEFQALAMPTQGTLNRSSAWFLPTPHLCQPDAAAPACKRTFVRPTFTIPHSSLPCSTDPPSPILLQHSEQLKIKHVKHVTNDALTDGPLPPPFCRCCWRLLVQESDLDSQGGGAKPRPSKRGKKGGDEDSDASVKLSDGGGCAGAEWVRWWC